MKRGDMVRALEGSIKGMYGIVTEVRPVHLVTSAESARGRHAATADVFWHDGSRQTHVATDYLEIIGS